MELDCVQEAHGDQAYALENVVDGVYGFISCVHMCMEMAVRWRGRPSFFFFFFSLFCSVYTPMFIQVDEVECVSAGKTTTVFLSVQSLLLLRDNGITHQRSLCLYPILLWPLPAFVHIHHDNSSGPSLHQQASPCFPSVPRERLNLDENEIFISTQRLMAILIWYKFWCNISSLFFITKRSSLNVLSLSFFSPTVPSSCG